MGIEIKLDYSIYSDSCISKTVYDLSNRFTFIRKSINGGECIEMRLKDLIDEQTAINTFYDTLNDYKLRCIINEETSVIKDLLYAKAFANSNS